MGASENATGMASSGALQPKVVGAVVGAKVVGAVVGPVGALVGAVVQPVRT